MSDLVLVRARYMNDSVPLSMGATRSASWNTHYLLTRAALGQTAHPLWDEETTVQPLEALIAPAASELTRLAAWHRELIARRIRMTRPQDDELSVHTEGEFLSGIGLSPSSSFPLVRAVRPEECATPFAHTPSRAGPPGGVYEPTPEGTGVPVGDVLATYSDEPDWGMDQNLFPIKEYGYGPGPFGISVGKSSQAPFHMAFLHENRILTRLLPGLCASFLRERVELALALARLAFAKQVPYWGWRFTAWAMHYLQDVTQPYHAKAFPLSVPTGVDALRRYTGLHGLKGALGTALKSHHILFEATVHFLFNDAAKGRSESLFDRALSRRRETLQGPIDHVILAVSRTPARIAHSVDRALMLLFEGMGVNCEDEASVTRCMSGMDEVVARVRDERREMFGQFVELVVEALQETGMVTRYVWREIAGRFSPERLS